MDIPEFDTYKQTYWNHRYAEKKDQTVLLVPYVNAVESVFFFF